MYNTLIWIIVLLGKVRQVNPVFMYLGCTVKRISWKRKRCTATYLFADAITLYMHVIDVHILKKRHVMWILYDKFYHIYARDTATLILWMAPVIKGELYLPLFLVGMAINKMDKYVTHGCHNVHVITCTCTLECMKMTIFNYTPLACVFADNDCVNTHSCTVLCELCIEVHVLV